MVLAKLDSFFKPKSIAVIGASKKPDKIGYAVLKNIIDSGFAGEIYPLNPKEESILEKKAFAKITDINPPPELALICVPAVATEEVVKECGEAGVKNLVVITAGFKETGTQGLEREKKLVKLCQAYGMNMLGPNCVGLIDTHTPLNASFAKGFPKQGNIAFISKAVLC